jgi:ADP-heptose:LPS heptosyltransferase
MTAKKFLIIQTAFIGDVVLATALIEKLHQYYPDAVIDFLVRGGNEGLLKSHPLLREVLVWQKKKKKLINLLGLLTTIRSRKYDVVINVQRFAATGFLTTFSGAKVKIGFDKNPWSRFFSTAIPHIISTKENPLHETSRNQALISSLTDNIPAKPRLYPVLFDFEKVKPFKEQPYICIAPASVWFTKQYPANKWISFLNRVRYPHKIYLIGGPADFQLCESIRSGIEKPSRAVNLSGKLSLLESAALQQGAMMNYVNDSAPMHFASAMNAPVTAIYCSTLPSFGFGPLSDSSYIVEIKDPIPCRPCGLHGRKECPLGHFNCANNIQDEQLLTTLQSAPGQLN